MRGKKVKVQEKEIFITQKLMGSRDSCMLTGKYLY